MQNPAHDRIRLGVVGLGAIAQSVHLPLIARRWDLFELVAVAELSPSLREQVGAQYAVPPERRHEDLAALLAAGGVDGVLILTPGSHAGAALDAIEAGVAVFCEKPIAYSLAEVDAIRAAERAAGRPMLLLAYMKEYDPALLRMKERMPPLGQLRWAEVEVLHPSGGSQLAFANLRPPAGDVDLSRLEPSLAADRSALADAIGAAAAESASGVYLSPVVTSLIHDIAALRALTGGIGRVDAVHRWSAEEGRLSIAVDGAIAEGARFAMHWHLLPDYPAYHETITLHFSAATLRLEFAAPYLLNAPTVLTVVGRDGAGESVEQVRDVSEAFEAELTAFHAMVAGGVAPPTGSAEGRADLVVAQRIHRAYVEGLGGRAEGESARA